MRNKSRKCWKVKTKQKTKKKTKNKMAERSLSKCNQLRSRKIPCLHKTLFFFLFFFFHLHKKQQKTTTTTLNCECVVRPGVTLLGTSQCRNKVGWFLLLDRGMHWLTVALAFPVQLFFFLRHSFNSNSCPGPHPYALSMTPQRGGGTVGWVGG